MRRGEFRDAVRRAAEITGDRDLVVVGSQSIHGAFGDQVLPKAATASMEVDILAINDTHGDKTWQLLAVGGPNPNVEVDGVDITTAALPEGWVDRLVPFPIDESENPVIAWCLDPHDLVVSKSVAGRQKDKIFIEALIGSRLADPLIAAERLGHLDPGSHQPRPTELETAAVYLRSLRASGRLFNTARVDRYGSRRPRRFDFPVPKER